MSVQAIIDCVTGVAVYADRRSWDQLRRLYDDEVEVDYTSLIGGQPARMRADELIAGWQTGLSRYRATQHLLGNYRIESGDDTAQAMVYVQATHWLPLADDEPSWTLHGHYEYSLRRDGQTWLITRHTLMATIVYGSRTLLQMQGVRPEWLS